MKNLVRKVEIEKVIKIGIVSIIIGLTLYNLVVNGLPPTR